MHHFACDFEHFLHYLPRWEMYYFLPLALTKMLLHFSTGRKWNFRSRCAEQIFHFSARESNKIVHPPHSVVKNAINHIRLRLEHQFACDFEHSLLYRPRWVIYYSSKSMKIKYYAKECLKVQVYCPRLCLGRQFACEFERSSLFKMVICLRLGFWVLKIG